MNIHQTPPKITADHFNDRAAQFLPGYLGIEVLDIGSGRITGRLPLAHHHSAPNGFLHAGTVVSFADTLGGAATVANLPEGARGFTTIELKSNFFGTLLEGTLFGEGTGQHLGRTTQVWDVRVTEECGHKTLALFRCTNLILYPAA